MNAPQSERQIFLGYPLRNDSPTPPAIPPIELSPFLSLEGGDGANVTLIKVTSHTGTHVDAPSHVDARGITISDFQADELVFKCPVVIDLGLGDCEVVQPAHLEPFILQAKEADLLLCRFGYGDVRSKDPARFSTKCPGFGVESARYLLSQLPNLRALGMDVPSLACIEYLDQTMAAHNVLLGGKGRRFMVIEDMKLDEDLRDLFQVIVAPWWIAGLDGGPCLVIGKLMPAI
jgi:kynurenine formamidase